MFKKLSSYFLILCLIALWFWYRSYQNDYFSLAKVHHVETFHPKWEAPVSSEEQKNIASILGTPFYYLSRGRQCFVFESLDHQYVIKLFNHQRFTYPTPFLKLPLPSFLDKIRQKKLARRANRKEVSFTSYAIAFQELKKESGLLYIHLNPTPETKVLLLIDKNQSLHQIPLSDVAFVVQKKATLFFSSLDTFRKEGGKPKMEKGISSFLQLILTRCQKQIADGDVAIGQNFGFLQDEAIIFDTGRLYKDPELVFEKRSKKEFMIAMKPLRKWLQINHPDVLPYLDKESDNLFQREIIATSQEPAKKPSSPR